jgi:hypothetical protein
MAFTAMERMDGCDQFEHDGCQRLIVSSTVSTSLYPSFDPLPNSADVCRWNTPRR